MKFDVSVLTKRESIRVHRVTAPWEEAAKQHVLRTMKKGERVISIRPAH